MDESWRKRQPTIHPHRKITSTKDLGADDFCDVFGGPPRSILLRHFSPSTRVTKKEPSPSYDPDFYNSDHNLFRVVKREEGTLPCTAGLSKSDHASKIRYGHNALPVMQREPRTSSKAIFYHSDHASKTGHARNGFRVMKGEDDTTDFHYGFQISKEEYAHSGFQVMKGEDETLSFKSDSHKQDHFCTSPYEHNGFHVLKREDSEKLDPNRIRVKSSEDCDNGFCNEAFGYQGFDRVPLDEDARNEFQIMKEKDDVSCNLNFHKSNHVSTTTRYARSVFPIMKTEAGFSGEVFRREVSNPSPFLDNGIKTLKREEEFYDDIFGSDIHNGNAGLRRSRTRSVAMSESESPAIICCEEDNRGFESFAAKLRPITIPSRRYDSSTSSSISEEITNSTLQNVTTQYPSSPSTHFKKHPYSNNANSSKIKFINRCNNSSFCCFTPPETDSLDPSFRLSFGKTLSENNSPSEVEKNVVLEMSRGIDENMANRKGAFVIKMDCYAKTQEESGVGSEAATALDEAIAWAKERFMNQNAEAEGKNENCVGLKDWNAQNGKECKER